MPLEPIGEEKRPDSDGENLDAAFVSVKSSVIKLRMLVGMEPYYFLHKRPYDPDCSIM